MPCELNQAAWEQLIDEDIQLTVSWDAHPRRRVRSAGSQAGQGRRVCGINRTWTWRNW